MQRLESLTILSRELQENCFNACATDNQTTFLTIKEGMCFRNCITKFSLWYATYGDASQDAAWRDNRRQLDAAAGVTEPWKGKEKLLNKVI